jgi:hypothetical protein
MAHFAQLDESNVVVQVIVVSNDICNSEYPASEPVGQAFIASINIEGRWLQTSYNNNFRGRYAGIGYIYDAELDEFIVPPLPPAPELPIEE